MKVDEWKLRIRKRQRLRTHGTRNPFCCVCGEHSWAVRYDLHHFAGRKFDPRVIRLCHPCHDKVTDMLKDFPPIPPSTDPRLARFITITRGRIVMNRLALQIDEEWHDWLMGASLLPPLPQAPGPGSADHD